MRETNFQFLLTIIVHLKEKGDENKGTRQRHIFFLFRQTLLTTEYSKRCLTMDKEIHVLKLSTEKKAKKFLHQILYAANAIAQADI